MSTILYGDFEIVFGSMQLPLLSGCSTFLASNIMEFSLLRRQLAGNCHLENTAKETSSGEDRSVDVRKIPDFLFCSDAVKERG